ncbi:hypothetical protein ACE1CD_14590 [Aerosakkonema sp. BLCC-F183]|uniref:hypothetical protein n=1 Tax=Aerosakkonema sp. BLCC-F183 TaxID=3342834 RepID=UPI0035B776B3
MMSDRLEQLFFKARQQELETQERQLTLIELVEEILRSRTICRPLVGNSLSQAQQQIYAQVKTQLLSKLSEQIDSYNPTQISVKSWMTEIRLLAIRTVLNDEHLKQLALEIQQQPPQTKLRRHLLGELVEAIQLSGRLGHPHREKFVPEFYDLIYEEAVVRTLTYVCKNIDLYDAERGQKQKFMNWVNFRLDRLIIECRREFSEPMMEDLASLDQLENLPQPESDSLLEQTREYIVSDPDNIFEKEHIRNRPDANFRAIALARFNGQSWEEISADLDIKVPTLSGFFQKSCSKFRAKFREYTSP